MNDSHEDVSGRGPDASMLAALPIGICLYSFDGRLLSVTDAYCAALGVPAEVMRPGASFIDTMRVLAYRGIFGPGDPDRQAEAVAAGDRNAVRRLRRRTPDGRSLELHFAPLSDGRLLVSVTDLTALAAPRQQAETSARRLSDAFESMPLGMAVFDPARTLLFSNRRFAELLARPPEKLANGATFAQLAHTLQDGSYASALPDLHAPDVGLGRLLDGTGGALRCLVDTGELIELTANPLASGGWLVTVCQAPPLPEETDTANRQQRLVGRVLECLPHGVCIYGPDRRVSLFNRAYAGLLRQGVRLGDRFDASPFAQADAVIDTTRPQTLRHAAPGGEAIELFLTPLPDGGFACVTTDLSALLKQEEALHRRAELMDLMVMSLHQGVLLWDAERRLIACNRRAAELLELPPERLAPGRRHADLLADFAANGAFGPPEESAARLENLLSRDRTRHHAHRRSNRAGRVLEVNSDPVPGGGFVVTYSDVTEYRMAEDSLRRAREAAEAANSAKSRFLATMTHELRTPLNAVIGYSEALAREAADQVDRDRIADFTRRANEFATTINKAGHDLLNLINDILDVARIESGRFELAADRIELPRLVAACVRQAAGAARSGQVTIYADLPDALPILHGDERRLRQVLSHLIGNAVKFTDPGGSVRIDAVVAAEGDLLLSVSDTGIGIAEGDVDRVFEPFYQVDSGLARRASGSGLGLYVCQALVAAHGGTIQITSRPGQGTNVVVRLPGQRLESK